ARRPVSLEQRHFHSKRHAAKPRRRRLPRRRANRAKHDRQKCEGGRQNERRDSQRTTAEGHGDRSFQTDCYSVFAKGVATQLRGNVHSTHAAAPPVIDEPRARMLALELSVSPVGPWRSWERASMASRRSWVRIPSAPQSMYSKGVERNLTRGREAAPTG